jgi:hypothetical protein
MIADADDDPRGVSIQEIRRILAGSMERFDDPLEPMMPRKRGETLSPSLMKKS